MLKFAQGFFTGMLVTDCIMSAGLLYLCYYNTIKLKEKKQPLSRYHF